MKLLHCEMIPIANFYDIKRRGGVSTPRTRWENFFKFFQMFRRDAAANLFANLSLFHIAKLSNSQSNPNPPDILAISVLFVVNWQKYKQTYRVINEDSHKEAAAF